MCDAEDLTARGLWLAVAAGHRCNGENLLLGPLVLPADLLLLLGGEVVLDVERLADLLGRFALDHVCDSLAADIEKSLDVHVVGSEDDLEEHLLVDLHELLVPLFNVGGLLAVVGILILGGGGVLLVVVAPLENLSEDGFANLWWKVSEQLNVNRVEAGA